MILKINVVFDLIAIIHPKVCFACVGERDKPSRCPIKYRMSTVARLVPKTDDLVNLRDLEDTQGHWISDHRGSVVV